MLVRRAFLAGLATGAATGVARAAGAALTEDGLYSQPWFMQSLLELKDDLEETTAKKKRFAILWELKGCPYCKDMHFVNFADEAIVAYIRTHFELLQMNIIGARTVVDFDGQSLPERAFAARYAIRGTPTIQFFGEDAAALRGMSPMQREVARANGYMKPPAFLAMFRFVAEKAYERGSFADYMKAKS